MVVHSDPQPSTAGATPAHVSSTTDTVDARASPSNRPPVIDQPLGVTAPLDRNDRRDERALAAEMSRALLALALGILVAFVNAKVSASFSFTAGMVLSFLAFILAAIGVILEHIVPLVLDPRAAVTCKICLCAGLGLLVGAILCYLHYDLRSHGVCSPCNAVALF